MRALFGRKVVDLQELRELTEEALKEGGLKGEEYTVEQEVELIDEAFREFTGDFLKDQPWINPKASCIRVINKDTGKKVLILPEGYQYPRYTGLELE